MSNNNFWDNTDSVPVEDEHFWEDDAKPLKSEKESFVRGAAQGASFGFADEITGGLEALRDIAMTDKELDDFVTQYRQRRDESRGEYDQAQEDNPWSYGGGVMAGGVTSSLLPGGAALNAAKGAKLSAVVAKGALAGGIAGAGASKSDLTEGDVGGFVGDVAKDAAIGGATGGALHGVGKAIGAIPKALKSAGKLVTDLDDDAIDAIQQNKGLLQASRKAPTNLQLGDILEEGSRESFKIQKKLDDEVWEALGDFDMQAQNGFGEVGYKEIIDSIRTNISEYADLLADGHDLSFGDLPAQKAAKKALDGVKEAAGNVNSFTDMKRLVSAIDSNINWDDPSATLKNQLLTRYRTHINDGLRELERFRQFMQPHASITGALDTVGSRLSMKGGRLEKEILDGSGEVLGEVGDRILHPTDRTTSTIDTLVSQTLSSRGKNDQLRNAAEVVSPEFSEGLKAAALRRYLEKDTARGSRSAVTGGVSGAALGALTSGLDIVTGGVGAAMGAAGGWARDKFGREVGAYLVDKAAHGDIATGVRNFLSNHPRISATAGRMLEEAAKRSPQTLILTHTLLKERIPEYKAAVEDKE